MKRIIEIETKRADLEKGNDEYTIFSANLLGEITFSDGEIRIEYNDGDIHTVMTVTEKYVTVYSKGITSSSLVFSLGKHCTGEYSITEGSLQVTTYTYDITNALTENGGVLTIDYEIDFGGNVCDRSTITYRIK